MNHDALTPEFYEALVWQSSALISVLDKNGIYKFVSKSALQLVGYNPEELLGKTAMEYIHNNDLQAMKAAFLQLDSKKETEVPAFRFRTKKGKWRWMEAIITNSLEEEHIHGYVIDARDVTLKREAQEKLEKSHSFYSSVYYNHPDAVFTLTPNGIFEEVNANACRILAYGKEEIVGEHFSKFIAPSFSFEAIKALSKAGNCETSSIEGKVVNKYGKTRTLSFTIIPICSSSNVMAILGIAKDISAEKNAQKSLERLSLVASKAVSCVVITDAAGYIEWVNSEFTKVTGYSMLEAIGEKPGELLQGEETDPATIQQMHNAIQRGEPVSVEVINYRKNGEKFWFYMDITPIYNEDLKLSQFFAIQYDISERKEAEQKMLMLSEDLSRHNRELQQFNYIVSHNLRAPVANIVGLVSLLDSMNGHNGTFAKVLQKLKQTTSSLDNVIKDLDEILSLRNRNSERHLEEACIKTICDEVIRSLQDRADTIGAKIQIAVPEDVCIQANKAYLYSIFHNLLSNSLKYYNKERPLHVTVSYTSEPAQHLITFRDNGTGIDLSRFGSDLFKLYAKFDKKKEGRGIGLYMVKAQVEVLGGTIEVDSTPGAGTAFYIRFNKEEPLPQAGGSGATGTAPKLES